MISNYIIQIYKEYSIHLLYGYVSVYIINIGGENAMIDIQYFFCTFCIVFGMFFIDLSDLQGSPSWNELEVSEVCGSLATRGNLGSHRGAQQLIW